MPSLQTPKSVALYVTCLADILRPSVAFAAVKLLQEVGCEVVVPKRQVMANLHGYLMRFEQKVLAQGGQVHWAGSTQEARAAILSICRAADAKTVTKGKSMVTEELGQNEFLKAQGMTPVETDLGEYILQLRQESPSHIVVPAVHLQQDDVRQTFVDRHTHFDPEQELITPESLVEEARRVLRRRFSEADVEITGANYLIAETGSTVIVTNEGNGDLTQTLPKVHVVVTTIERVIPTLDDLSTFLRLLGRSATGQDATAYVTLSCSPRQDGDLYGPEAFHVVLLDGGRSDLLGTEKPDLLNCIRCGACMNCCPVYACVGGHAYGWVYPGSIGAVLTPALIGLEKSSALYAAYEQHVVASGASFEPLGSDADIPAAVARYLGEQGAPGQCFVNAAVAGCHALYT